MLIRVALYVTRKFANFTRETKGKALVSCGEIFISKDLYVAIVIDVKPNSTSLYSI